MSKPNPTIEELLQEIGSIVARLERRKYGEMHPADDHNLLVNFAEKQRDLNEELSAAVVAEGDYTSYSLKFASDMLEDTGWTDMVKYFSLIHEASKRVLCLVLRLTPTPEATFVLTYDIETGTLIETSPAKALYRYTPYQPLQPLSFRGKYYVTPDEDEVKLIVYKDGVKLWESVDIDSYTVSGDYPDAETVAVSALGRYVAALTYYNYVVVFEGS